jgi:hypothetical protein
MPDPIVGSTRLGRPPKVDKHLTPTRDRLLHDWQTANAAQLREQGLTPTQITMFYLLLMRVSHIDTVNGLSVDLGAMEAEIDGLIDGWIDCRIGGRIGEGRADREAT